MPIIPNYTNLNSANTVKSDFDNLTILKSNDLPLVDVIDPPRQSSAQRQFTKRQSNQIDINNWKNIKQEYKPKYENIVEPRLQQPSNNNNNTLYYVLGLLSLLIL